MIVGGIVREVLLPRTDAGVLAQLITVLVAGGAGLWLARHHHEGRLFVTGLIVFIISFFGLRALH